MTVFLTPPYRLAGPSLLTQTFLACGYVYYAGYGDRRPSVALAEGVPAVLAGLPGVGLHGYAVGRLGWASAWDWEDLK